MRANTEWFKESRWGVFLHYLASPASSRELAEITSDDWNRQVDSFDVEGLAAQLDAVGAKCLTFTLGQNSGYYCSPNATYDALVGRKPSRCSQRDLIKDIYEALKPRGIKMLAYLPSHAPAMDVQAIEGLGCTPAWDAGLWGFKGNHKVLDGTDDRLSTFQRNWEAIIREWSMRWGTNIVGWNLDGVYYADTMYRHPDEPNFKSFAAAMKAGNPESIVAFNPGWVKFDVKPVTEYEDYTVGEGALSLPVCDREFVEGARYHILSYLGEYWGQGTPRFLDEMVIGYTKQVNHFGGVVTWDVPVSTTGVIPQPYIEQLTKLNAALTAQV